MIRCRVLACVLQSAGAVINPALLSASLQSGRCLLTSVDNAGLSLLLGFSYSNPAWLAPAITPHPGVELIDLAAIPCAISAVSHYSLSVTETVRQGWSLVSIHEARQQWYSAQHILSPANVQ